jgi:hypothetical protein
MIGNDPILDRFVHEYATSTEIISLEKWGEKYGVQRQTISKWIKEYATDIEEICAEIRTEFNKNIQRIGGKALGVINRALDEGNEDIAVKVMPYIATKKEHIEVGGTLEVNQPMSIAIKKMRETDAGGS